jgi:hypothetical protein
MPKINEIPVETPPLAIIEKRHLWRTSGEGEILDGVDRQGVPNKLSFSAGAFVLSDDEGNVLCGPISRGAAHMLAVDIIAGAGRTATRPGLALHFATVILGMTLEPSISPAALAEQFNPLAKALETTKLLADQKEALHG